MNVLTFSADCKTLEQSIKRVLSVVGPSCPMFITVHNGIRVCGLGSDTFASCTVPDASSEDSEGITCLPEKLVGLIKGRTTMDFVSSAEVLRFKQQKGRYSGELPIVAVSEDQKIQIKARLTEDFESSAVSADILSVVRQGVQATAVRDVYLNSTLMSYITLDNGLLTVSSFDGQHFGLLKAQLDTTESFKTALPQTHFGFLDTFASGEDIVLGLSKRGIRARGKTFDLSMPATQSDERHYDMVEGFVKALPDESCKCLMPTTAFAEVVLNLYTLYNPNSNFVLNFSKGTLAISLSSTSGSASDTISVKFSGDESKASVDPRLLVDLVGLMRKCESIRISVRPSVLLFYCKYGKADLILSCARVE